MKHLMAVGTLALVAALCGNVYAHGDQPKHGGIVKESSDAISFELVHKDNRATIYVEDHGKKVATAGATGKLTVLNGTDKTDVPLAPAGDNIMVTSNEVRLAKGAKVMASVTFADKRTVNVRFSIR